MAGADAGGEAAGRAGGGLFQAGSAGALGGARNYLTDRGYGAADTLPTSIPTDPIGMIVSAYGVVRAIARNRAKYPSPEQREAFIRAGGTVRVLGEGTPLQIQTWYFDGRNITPQQAFAIGQKQLKFESRTSPDVPPPTGGSVFVPALPNVPPFIANLPNTMPGVGAAAARILAPIIAVGLFWPSSTSSTDVIYGQEAARPRATPGGRTRGRRGRRARARPRPVAVPKDRPGTPRTISKRVVRAGPQVIEDIRLGGEVAPPIALPSSSSSSAPSTSSSSIPAPTTAGQGAWPYPSTSSPWPSSAPATSSPWSKVAPYVAPFLGTLVGPFLSPQAQPLPRTQLAPDPLTQANAAALPFAATQAQTRDCSCAKTKKRRKKGCTNPVTSRTHKTRGGRKFVTVTRRIECPASSRKKLP